MKRRPKRKYPSELNTRIIRISLVSYNLLMEISKIRGITMAEAFDLVINLKIRQKQVAIKPSTQLVSPAIPIAYRAIPKIAMATNGSGAAAFRINPKGARYD